MESVSLRAKKREAFGKGAVRKMRREGFVPAVLYGRNKEEAIPLTLSYSDVNRIIAHIERENVLVDLHIEGNGKEEKIPIIFKEIQRDPVTDKLLHLDLYELVKGQKIHVSVPIHLVGKPVGVEMGGIIQNEVRELEIECLPKDLPPHIEIEISHLNIGDALHLRDINVSDAIKLLDDPDTTILSIVAPVKEEVVAKTTEEVEEEIAESFEETEAEGEAEEKEEG